MGNLLIIQVKPEDFFFSLGLVKSHGVVIFARSFWLLPPHWRYFFSWGTWSWSMYSCFFAWGAWSLGMSSTSMHSLASVGVSSCESGLVQGPSGHLFCLCLFQQFRLLLELGLGSLLCLLALVIFSLGFAVLIVCGVLSHSRAPHPLP